MSLSPLDTSGPDAARSGEVRPAGRAVEPDAHPRRTRHAERFGDREGVPPVWRVLPAALAVAVVAGASVALGAAAPLGVAVAVVLAGAAWRRPVIAAAVVASVVPAMSGLERGGVVPGFKVSELLLVACAVAVFLRRPRGWRPLSGVDLAMIAFAVVGLVLGVLHAVWGNIDVDTLLRSGLLPAFLLVTWWTASRGVADAADLRTVLRWVLLVSLVPALVGILQHFDVLGARELVVTVVGEDGLGPLPGATESRATGPFPIAHSFGGYLIVPTLLAALLLLREDTTVLRRGWLVLVLAVDMVAVVLAVTVTLLAWVPIALLVGAALVQRVRWAVFLLAVVTLASLVLFSDALVDRFEQQTTAASGTEDGLVPQTLQYRILVWQRDYLPLVGRVWPVGIGLDNPENVQFEATENQYLTLLLRGGVALLVAAVVALTAIAVRAAAHARTARTAPEGVAAATVVGILVFLPAAAMVWPYVTNAGLPQSLLGFAGAALALDHWRPRLRRAPLYGPLADPGPVPVPAAERVGAGGPGRA